MSDFFCTLDTIDRTECDGFELFGAEHIVWLIILLASVISLSILYRRGCTCGCGSSCPRREGHRRQAGQDRCRHGMRMVMAMLMIADELLKYVLVAVNSAPLVRYVPLQLCSICVIAAIVHAFMKPGSRGAFYIGNFLYLVGIAAGLSAILFPAWTGLPAFNLMSIHSFTAHILLVSYILMILAGGEIKVSVKTIPVSVTALIIMAGLVYVFDVKTGMNFMYLIALSPGSPLAGFEALGDYRLGYVVILAALVVLLYGVSVVKMIKNK